VNGPDRQISDFYVFMVKSGTVTENGGGACGHHQLGSGAA
jgi:hypothetical protein